MQQTLFTPNQNQPPAIIKSIESNGTSSFTSALVVRLLSTISDSPNIGHNPQLPKREDMLKMEQKERKDKRLRDLDGFS
ncbi:unnamed protein product [Dovyalis caffra]|uniref:Uncharacterized protein n=1 Tax=Dovyalis caffra TaxID=77055 RepID=A0AAV1SK19_9ROSI|nr:unnamed protein product [Dovyalis caffra]